MGILSAVGIIQPNKLLSSRWMVKPSRAMETCNHQFAVGLQLLYLVRDILYIISLGAENNNLIQIKRRPLILNFIIFYSMTTHLDVSWSFGGIHPREIFFG